MSRTPVSLLRILARRCRSASSCGAMIVAGVATLAGMEKEEEKEEGTTQGEVGLILQVRVYSLKLCFYKEET